MPSGFDDPAWVTWAVNLVLLVLAIELVWLLVRRPWRWSRLLAAGSGLGLLLAWRLSLWGLPPGAVGLCLGLAGLSHLGEWIAEQRRSTPPRA